MMVKNYRAIKRVMKTNTTRTDNKSMVSERKIIIRINIRILFNELIVKMNES